MLQAQVIERGRSESGLYADLLLVEPNGDSYAVRCLAKEDGTELCGDPEAIDYLNERYGSKAVCFTARDATLAGDD